MALETQTPTLEGIFEVRRERVSYWDRELRITEAMIKEIREREIYYDSPTSFRKGIKISGVDITLENDRGTATVEFPRKFVFAEKVLIGERVKYTKLHELYDDGGAIYKNEYNLKILTGLLAGGELNEKVIS